MGIAQHADAAGRTQRSGRSPLVGHPMMEHESRLPAQVEYFRPPVQHAGGAATQPQQDGLDPRTAWNVVRRNRLIIFVSLVLMVGLAVLLTARATPIYQSQASLRIEDTDPSKSIVDLRGLSG